MDRAIVAFELDPESHWVARLACGHGRHVRHDPPLSERPWVQDEAGRRGRLGTPLDCVRCDRSELPEGYAPYNRTPEFTESTVPAALLEHHTTKAGIWGLIHVVRGTLRYVIGPPFEREERLTTSAPGVVLPEVVHHVDAQGPVAFYVEFWRRPPEPSV